MDELHGGEPALISIGANLRFHGGGNLRPNLSTLLFHTNLLTGLNNSRCEVPRGKRADAALASLLKNEGAPGGRMVKKRRKVAEMRGRNVIVTFRWRWSCAALGWEFCGADMQGGSSDYAAAWRAVSLFTCCSHPLVSLPASGLRLETLQRCDKEISEVYFAHTSKKILTQNLNRQVPRASKLTAYRRG